MNSNIFDKNYDILVVYSIIIIDKKQIFIYAIRRLENIFEQLCSPRD